MNGLFRPVSFFARLHGGDIDEMREALGQCGPDDPIGHMREASRGKASAEKPLTGKSAGKT